MTLSVSDRIASDLPYLRRYARALTGTQDRGDTYAAATLEAIINDPAILSDELANKTALFQVFQTIWASTGGAMDMADTTLEMAAQANMARLTPGTREALLLHTIEDFTVSDVAQIMQIEATEAKARIDTAMTEMEAAVRGRVMIIEDEVIIATDLEGIVVDMGHTVTGIARTAAAARGLAEADRPDLILSDIQLADDSSGIDAVNDILDNMGDIPVIFITAFPERLLTGNGPEPAFLIAKPFTEAQVHSAVSQAMFFRSTASLLSA